MHLPVLISTTLLQVAGQAYAFHGITTPTNNGLLKNVQSCPNGHRFLTSTSTANSDNRSASGRRTVGGDFAPLSSTKDQATSDLKTGTTSWAQRTVTITAPSRGCHLITSEITRQMPELRSFKVGMANIFLKHTSASLTINENADPDVRTDLETALNEMVPVKWHHELFRHTIEGPDDMTGHVKSSVLGASLNIPITNGCLALGMWQGIYLCEHRDVGGFGGGFRRDIVITVQGISAD